MTKLKSLKAEKSKKLNLVKAFIRLLPITFRASPFLFVLHIILEVAHGISWAVITIFTQKFFDSATHLVDKKVSLWVVILSLVALGIVHIITQILNGVENFVGAVFIDKASGKLSEKIHKKISKLSAISFEDTNTLEDINKAEQGKNNAVTSYYLF